MTAGFSRSSSLAESSMTNASLRPAACSKAARRRRVRLCSVLRTAGRLGSCHRSRSSVSRETPWGSITNRVIRVRADLWKPPEQS